MLIVETTSREKEPEMRTCRADAVREEATEWQCLHRARSGAAMCAKDAAMCAKDAAMCAKGAQGRGDVGQGRNHVRQGR